MEIKCDLITFGELESGEHFTLMVVDTLNEFLQVGNVKLKEEGVSLLETFKNHPLNVVSLDGRFRTYRDHEKVYKISIDNNE